MNHPSRSRSLFRALFSFTALFLCINVVQGQFYFIDFAASGLSSSLDSVRVENVNQGTSLMLMGDDTLHLLGATSLQKPVAGDPFLKAFPNPFSEHTEIQFLPSMPGQTTFSLYDHIGRQLYSRTDVLQGGAYSYILRGLSSGVYFVRISGAGQDKSCKLIASDNSNAPLTASLSSLNSFPIPQSKASGLKSIITMAYNTGDSLIFTAYSSIYTDVVSAIPLSSGTIAFSFIVLPVLTTDSVTAITTNSATSGGNITFNGGDVITARGVCWSTAPNPDLNDAHSTDGSGMGSFVSNISTLTPLTTYYVRAYATNGAGTAYGNPMSFTTLAWTNVAIGDNFQGGKVAYILQAGDPGYSSSQQHGIIAAASDQHNGIAWYNGVSVLTGASGTAIGTGNSNTNTIISVQGSGSYAAQLCADLVLNGYSDWYLPSKDELYKLFLSKTTVGGYTSLLYWTSTELNATDAWIMSFNSGNQISYGKNWPTAVRAIRAF